MDSLHNFSVLSCKHGVKRYNWVYKRNQTSQASKYNYDPCHHLIIPMNRFCHQFSKENSLKRILIQIDSVTGRMNAKKVHDTAPVRLIKSPNLGILIASKALKRASRDLNRILLSVLLSLWQHDPFLKQLALYIISNAGVIISGYVQSNPTQ